MTWQGTGQVRAPFGVHPLHKSPLQLRDVYSSSRCRTWRRAQTKRSSPSALPLRQARALQLWPPSVAPGAFPTRACSTTPAAGRSLIQTGHHIVQDSLASEHRWGSAAARTHFFGCKARLFSCTRAFLPLPFFRLLLSCPLPPPLSPSPPLPPVPRPHWLARTTVVGKHSSTHRPQNSKVVLSQRRAPACLALCCCFDDVACALPTCCTALPIVLLLLQFFQPPTPPSPLPSVLSA